MSDLILIGLLLVILYYLWAARRALLHICAQLSLLCKFTQEMKCHLTGTAPDPGDDINKILGIGV